MTRGAGIRSSVDLGGGRLGVCAVGSKQDSALRESCPPRAQGSGQCALPCCPHLGAPCTCPAGHVWFKGKAPLGNVCYFSLEAP